MAKVAVITGAALRIGRSLATHLHACGYDIALHYRRSEAAARDIADTLCAQRASSCTLFCADLSEPAQVSELSREILATYPRIDLLVNNASGFEATPLQDATPAQFDVMIDSNLKGPYFLIQGLLPGLLATRGCIVNIVDVHVERPLPGFNVYGAAKAGLASLTRSLAVELGPDIRVNGVAPGAVLWPEGDDAYDEATRKRTVANTPLQRLGEPLDIARTVAFLADDAPFITGQVITVDGGRNLVA
ncbi:MAG: pteridine reductase [Bacteroidia bacterium]|jgi:pteridine reductase